jgi:uncharacterized protein involved in exopolysaccharide biosynthesis/Mrp family chromosome partitioning ATPase
MELQLAKNGQARVAQKGTPVPLNADPFEGSSKDYLDLRRIWNALVRERRLVFAPVIVTMGAVLLYLLFATSLYSATAQLLVDSPKPKIIRGEAIVSGLDTNRFTLGPVIDSEVEILQSTPLAERVLRETKLYLDRNWVGRQGPLSWTKTLIRQSVYRIMGWEAKPQAEIPQELIDKFLSQLEVKRKGLSLILLVKFTDKSPERAALVANQIAASYLNDQRESKVATIRQANDRLRAQVDQLRIQVVDAEQQVQRYREANNLISVGGMSVGEREMADTLQQLTAARAELSARAAEKDEAERISADPSASVTSLSRVMRSEVITNLRRQESEVQRKIATLVSQYGAQHQQVERTQAELRDLRREIDAEVGRLLQNARNDHAVALGRVKLLEKKAEQLKEETVKRSMLTIKLGELERQAKATSDLYSSLLSRLAETQAQESMVYEDARIVADAAVPRIPSAPNTPLILTIALLGSIGCGITLVLLKDHMSPVVRTREDAESTLGMRVVAVLPPLADNGDILRDIVRNRGSAYAQEIFALRRWLLEDRAGSPGKITAVVSASEGEGKTAVAANLAQYAAQVQMKALLVDCNLRRPDLSAHLSPASEKSFVDVLTGHATLSEVIVRDSETGLHFCPGGGVADPLHAMEVLSSGRLGDFLRAAAQAYNIVVVDTGALLPNVDTRSLLNHVDAAILVVEAGRTSAHEIAECRRLVPALAAKQVGLVINKAGTGSAFEWRQVLDGAAALWSGANRLWQERRPRTKAPAIAEARFNASEYPRRSTQAADPRT